MILKHSYLWECPNCNKIAKSHSPEIRFHNCSGLHGMYAPMVHRGTKAKVEVKEREDYVGKESVTYLEDRPIMSIVTTRDEGQDTVVMAPTAKGSAA